MFIYLYLLLLFINKINFHYYYLYETINKIYTYMSDFLDNKTKLNFMRVNKDINNISDLLTHTVLKV